MGGSNSISSIDLSNAYNGVADYNIAAVGVLLFSSNWAGPIWCCSAAVLFMLNRPVESARKPKAQQENEREWVLVERTKLRENAMASASLGNNMAQSSETGTEGWSLYVSAMTAFMSTSLIAVMAACTALRTHLFIWTVFSPKYLYAMAWSLVWHLLINIGLGSLLYSLRGVA